MPRPKLKRRKRSYETCHRRTAATPFVRQLIQDLRGHWGKLDRIERGERLSELIRYGCSTRGVAADLGISQTTVRRHITLAELPNEQREAVKAGFSAKKTLASKELADRRRRTQKRVVLDAKTGKLSDRLADTILAFCKTVHSVPDTPIAEEFLVKFLNEVRTEACKLESKGARFPKLSKRLTLKEQFHRTRPPVETDMRVVHLSEWLAILLLTEAPERPIWESAIEKAARRAQELRRKVSPIQLWHEAQQRRAEKSAELPRRRY